MVALYVVAGLIAYFTVGGILSGILCEDDKLGMETVAVWFGWPLVIVSAAFVILMFFPYKLGTKIVNGRKMRHYFSDRK